LQNQKEKDGQYYYKTKYSTKKNSGKFKVLTKARMMLIDGKLSQESYDLFVKCMREDDDL
jgi:hypothetical protein